MEEKILKSFKRYEGKSVEGLELIVSIPDDYAEEHTCEIMEKKDNGRVWSVTCNRNHTVIDVFELS